MELISDSFGVIEKIGRGLGGAGNKDLVRATSFSFGVSF